MRNNAEESIVKLKWQRWMSWISRGVRIFL